MSEHETSDEDLNEKIYLILEEIFKKHDKSTPEFMMTIFLNGVTNALAIHALNYEAAQEIALAFSVQLLQAVDALKEQGAFNRPEHLQ
jgi:hypothetical protein